MDIIGTDASVAWAEVWSETPGARFAAYASVVDNSSGDPVLVQPVPVTRMTGQTGPAEVPDESRGRRLQP